MTTRPVSGSRMLTLPPVQTTRLWRGSSWCSRASSTFCASSIGSGLGTWPAGPCLGSKRLEGLHHVVPAPAEVVVELDVLAVEGVVRDAVGLDGLEDAVLEARHRARRVGDRGVAAGLGASRNRPEHRRAEGGRLRLSLIHI